MSRFRHWLAPLILALAGCSPSEPTLHDESAIPEALEDWGVLYRQGARLKWTEPVAVYDLTTPLFTDYAHKLRTLYIPEGMHIEKDQKGQLSFPPGTIISKTFYYARGEFEGQVLKADFNPADIREGVNLKDFYLLETRLLVHYASGWKAISYVWDEEQKQARRKITGAVFPLTLADETGEEQSFHYVVPDANQCLGCHATTFNTRQAMPIGPAKPGFVNRDSPLGSGNQLADWQRRGWLPGSREHLPVAADWEDESQPLAERARTYLEINCAHCHSATGAGDTSGLWLDREVAPGPHLGICKPPVAAGQGTGGHYWSIVPGKPDESILTYRMASLDPGAMMPELGRSLVHEEGLTLVSRWIAGLDGQCTEKESIGAMSRS